MKFIVTGTLLETIPEITILETFPELNLTVISADIFPVNLFALNPLIQIEPDDIFKIPKTTAETDSVPDHFARIGGYTSIIKKHIDAEITDYNSMAFVVDTGIWNHPDLNIVGGKSFINDSHLDENGHGTHVAGIIGARYNKQENTVGACPGMPLFAVRVLGADGSGSTTDIIAGLNFILNFETPLKKLVNLSIGGLVSPALDSAVKTIINSGIIVCAAAGNETVNAAISSPARVRECITVGAMENSSSSSIFNLYPLHQSLSRYIGKGDGGKEENIPYNTFASYSNYGSVLDILAPGTIKSTYIEGYKTLSGTSMAAPLVLGSIAAFLIKFPENFNIAALQNHSRVNKNPAVEQTPVFTTDLCIYLSF